jgi:hypothetical protein
MKKLEQLIQEFDRNQIKKVSILIVEMFYGGYQLKDGYEKPEDDKIVMNSKSNLDIIKVIINLFLVHIFILE